MWGDTWCVEQVGYIKELFNINLFEMKSFSYFWRLCMVACLFAVGFTSCSDDDGPGSSADLVGTWEKVSSEGYTKRDGEITSEWDNTDTTERFEFGEDGSHTQYSYSRSNRNWRVDFKGTWKYKSGKLYQYDSDNDLAAEPRKVVALTETELVLELYSKEKDEGVVYEKLYKDTYRKVAE